MERSRGPLTIEPVTPENAAEAFQLLREFVVSIGKEAEFTISETGFRRNLLVDSPLLEVVVARYDGDIAGYASFRRQVDSWSGHLVMHISAIYVRPAFRARYLAAAIYLYLAQLAKSRGYGAIVGLVPRSNEALLGVYRAAGAAFTEYVMCEVKLDSLSEDILRLGQPRRQQPAPQGPA